MTRYILLCFTARNQFRVCKKVRYSHANSWQAGWPRMLPIVTCGLNKPVAKCLFSTLNIKTNKLRIKEMTLNCKVYLLMTSVPLAVIKISKTTGILRSSEPQLVPYWIIKKSACSQMRCGEVIFSKWSLIYSVIKVLRSWSDCLVI